MGKTLNKRYIEKHNVNQYVGLDVFEISRSLMKCISETRLKPATLAVLIQCAALIAVTVFLWGIQLAVIICFKVDLTFPILTFVCMQALIAAVFSSLAGMAIWWRWIHLCFPVAIWGMSGWNIPNEAYLTGFIISLTLFWTTFRSQVPFFPSRPVVWRQVAKVMPKKRSVRLIDIGSGLGDMSMYIAKARPDCHIEGIEIAPLPWLLSFLRAKIRRSKAIFKLGDYLSLDFADYDVIFAYLSPAAMPALWEKACHEMQPGSLLISLEFEIPGIPPSMRIAGYGNSPTIYVWRIS